MTPIRARAVALLVLLAVTGTYLATMALTTVSNDVTSTTLASWRIAETGAPWLEGYDYAQHERKSGLWIGEAANGHVVAFRSPGPIALGVPAYAVAALAGVSGFSLVPGSVTAVVLTVAAMGLLLGALTPHVGEKPALLAVAAVALTTPVWTVSADSLWTHPVTILGIAGMARAAQREQWWLVGLFGSVALWGRLHVALVVAVVGLGVAWRRREPGVALKVGVTSGAGLLLSFVWGRWMYSSWSPAGGYSVETYTTRATDATSPLGALANHAGLWVAPDRGLLVWTPVVVLLLPALVRSWRTLPDWSRWLLLGGVAYALVQGQLNAFMGGSGFYGYRLMLEPLLCAVPALVLAVRATGPRVRALLGPVLGLQFAVMSMGAPQQGSVLLEDSAWTDNSFVHLLAGAPVLVAWPVLLVLLGWLAGVVVRRRLAASGVAGVPSDVGARDDLDRV